MPLYQYFFVGKIGAYTNEGDCVLDCTMGSGSTLVACANTGRRGIGIESCEEYYDIAVKRVSEAHNEVRSPIFYGELPLNL